MGSRELQVEARREYIRCFSKLCNVLPNIANTDIIRAFLSRTTYKSLVHKLRRKGLRTTKELLDIATIHTLGEEVVGAIFDHSKGKGKREERVNDDSPDRSSKRKDRKGPSVDVLLSRLPRDIVVKVHVKFCLRSLVLLGIQSFFC